MELRAYQKEIIHETRQYMKQGIKSILITSPTGSGKTILTASMLKTCASKNMSAWFIVHRVELIRQSIQAFHDVGVRHGIIASGFQEAKRLPIQIASMQTLARRLDRYRKPQLIIYDECHHLPSGTWSKVFDHFPDAFHIGLTATPERLDGAGLGNHFQKMVHGKSVKWLIENGYLSPYRIYAPSSISTRGVHTRMGDFVKSELSELVDKPTITGCAIENYKKYCNKKRAIVFASSIEHSKHIVSQFNNNGIQAAHVDGGTEKNERIRLFEEFKKGNILILSNVDIAGEGVDVPAIEAVILLRPTQSLGMFLQQVGRSLRIFEGKKEAIILDHVGNVVRHGLPDEERNWSLSAEKRKKKQEGDNLHVKVCQKCFSALESFNKKCPYCGYEFEVQSRKIEEVEGELVEVDYAELRRKRLSAQGQCKTLEDLIEEGKKRGYKRPHWWASNVFKARQQKKVMGGVR